MNLQQEAEPIFVYEARWKYKEKSEKIIIDECELPFEDELVDSIERNLVPLCNSCSSYYGAILAERFSKEMAELLPFLQFKNAIEFHKQPGLERIRLWDQYIQTMPEYALLSEMIENRLTCSGQNLIMKQHLPQGWKFYNTVYEDQILNHVFAATEAKEGYFIADPSYYPIAKNNNMHYIPFKTKDQFLKESTPIKITTIPTSKINLESELLDAR